MDQPSSAPVASTESAGRGRRRRRLLLWALAGLAGAPIFVAEHVLDEVCRAGDIDFTDFSSMEEEPGE